MGRDPKIAPSGRRQSHHIAPIGGMGGIDFQEFLLGVAKLQAGGQKDLNTFFPIGPLSVVTAHPDDLLGDRTATPSAFMAQIMDDGLYNGHGIETWVTVKMLI